MSILLKQYFDEMLQLFPSLGSYLGERKFDDKYENAYSAATHKKYKQLIRKYKSLLNSVPEKEKKTLPFLSFQFFLDVESKQFDNVTWMLPIDPFENSVINMIFFGKEVYPLSTKKDIENLATRYHVYAKCIGSMIHAMKQGIRKKVVLPRFLCQHLLRDLMSFKESKGYVTDLSQVSNDANLVVERALNVYVEALESLIHFIANDYLPHCRNTIGLCFLPGGKETYKNIVVQETTLEILPEEVFKFGKQEVKRISNEFQKLKVTLGYSSSLSFSEFYKNIYNNANNFPKSEQELINYYKKQQKRIRAELVTKYFYKNVKKTYSITPVPRHMQKSSPAAFYIPNVGKVYINSRDLKENPYYSAYVLSIHEGEPGHHYQFQGMLENNVPRENIFAFNGNGFVEGWALYVESLGDYSDLEYFGKLCFEMLRAVRLVVDVGIHHYGWSWNRAFKYMKTYLPMKETEIETELIRYVCAPGQALCYKLGERMFKELQKEYLENHSDLRMFHKLILQNGVVPLAVLKKHMRTLFRQ